MLDPLIAVGGQAFGLRTPRATYEDLYVPVFGRYAARNAAAGAVAFEALTGAALDEAVLHEGLAALRTPGRLEVVAHEPAIVLDGAHNPAGAEALAEALGEFFRWERLHVVLAVSANKDVEGVVRPLAAIADVVHATRNDSVRSAEPEEVARLARAASRPPSRCGRRSPTRWARPAPRPDGATSCSSLGAVHGRGREAGARPRLRRFRLPPGPTSP